MLKLFAFVALLGSLVVVPAGHAEYYKSHRPLAASVLRVTILQQAKADSRGTATFALELENRGRADVRVPADLHDWISAQTWHWFRVEDPSQTFQTSFVEQSGRTLVLKPGEKHGGQILVGTRGAAAIRGMVVLPERSTFADMPTGTIYSAWIGISR